MIYLYISELHFYRKGNHLTRYLMFEWIRKLISRLFGNKKEQIEKEESDDTRNTSFTVISCEVLDIEELDTENE